MRNNRFIKIIVHGVLLSLTYSCTFGAVFAIALIIHMLYHSKNKKKPDTAVDILAGDILAICIVVANAFFLTNIKLSLVLLLHFAFLFELLFMGMVVLCRKKYGIIYIFFYSLTCNLLLTASPISFPLYFTVGLYNFNHLNFITHIMFPCFFESVFISIPVTLYQSKERIHANTSIMLQIAILLAMSIVVSLSVKNTYLSNKPVKKNSEKQSVATVVLQGGFTRKDYDYADKYDEFAASIGEYYVSALAESYDAELVVIPEGSFIASFEKMEEYRKSIKETAMRNKQYILADFHVPDSNGEDNNKLIMFAPHEANESYVKRNLVPFVESDSTNSGNTYETMHIHNKLLIPMICYDSVFFKNYMSQKYGDIFVVVSNDSFSDSSPLAMLHESITMMYAKTIGKPLLYASQSGISFFINETGHVTYLSKRFERTTPLIKMRF